MRTFIFYLLIIFLIVCSGWHSANTSGSVANASGEIVTLISILSAAVISCIFSVSKTLNLTREKSKKTFLFFMRDYWIKFFLVCAFCATITILGNILEWPSVSLKTLEIDIIGFLSLASLSVLVVMMFLDFPIAIRDMLYSNSDEKVKNIPTISVPEFEKDDMFGQITA